MWTSFSPAASLEYCDCAGELGPFDPMLAILAKVEPLSRPVGFQLLKMEGPKGELLPGMWPEEKGVRWGNEPARSLDNRFDEWAEFAA